MKALAISIAAIAAIAGFIHWTEAREKAADAAYTAYENCVRDQYGTTPAAYYQEHGTTPECN